jgi:transcriptional regulator with XRE-family HTH domain
MRDNLGEKIKNLLYAKRITQTALAKKIGVHKQVLANWVNGNRNPKKENLEKIAKALEVSPQELIFGGQKNFIENRGIIGDNNSNNFNADLKDFKIQLQDHEIRLLKLENEILRKELKK